MIETILTKSFEIVNNIIICMWLEYLKTLARICIVPSYKHSLVSLILEHAIRFNKKNAAEFALKNGAHPNVGNMQDLIFHNRYDILKLLLKNGLNPDLDLNLAIWFRRVELTELLLENVADVQFSIFQRGAIEVASRRDSEARPPQPKMVKLLLEIDAIWKEATEQRLSDEEAEIFLSSKPELAKDFLNARAIKVIDKIKQRDKLTGPEIKFFNNPEYKHLQAFQELDVLLLKNAELSRHSISSKLNRDVTKYILDFFPKHEELKLQTLLTPYGLKHSLKKQYIAGKEEYPLSSKNLDKIISETADEEYFNSPQGQYLT